VEVQLVPAFYGTARGASQHARATMTAASRRHVLGAPPVLARRARPGLPCGPRVHDGACTPPDGRL